MRVYSMKQMTAPSLLLALIRYFFTIAIISFGTTFIVLRIQHRQQFVSKQNPPPFTCFKHLVDNDTQTASSRNRVPDIFHILRFGNYPFQFLDAAQIRAIFLNHAPRRIYIHTDNAKHLQGLYWDMVRDIPIIRIKFNRLNKTALNGQEFSNIFHQTDVLRIAIMEKYGGVYVDRDVLILNSLRPFFKYEFVNQYNVHEISIMLLIGQRRARFLRLYSNLYKYYNGSLWYYNAGVLPRRKIIARHPHLVKQLGLEGGTEQEIMKVLYNYNLEISRYYYAAHLLIRWREEFYRPFNETNITHPEEYTIDNIRDYRCSLGQIFRQLFFGTRNLVSPKQPVWSVRSLVGTFGYPQGGFKAFEKRGWSSKVHSERPTVFVKFAQFVNGTFITEQKP